MTRVLVCHSATSVLIALTYIPSVMVTDNNNGETHQLTERVDTNPYHSKREKVSKKALDKMPPSLFQGKSRSELVQEGIYDSHGIRPGRHRSKVFQPIERGAVLKLIATEQVADHRNDSHHSHKHIFARYGQYSASHDGDVL